MKARELVELLQKHDPELEVFIQQADSRGRSPVVSTRIKRETNWDHKKGQIQTEAFIILEEW